jgi:hypothetical protein
MNSMETFNPDAECLVHDQLNSQLIAWNPNGLHSTGSSPSHLTSRDKSPGTACFLTDGCRTDRDKRVSR